MMKGMLRAIALLCFLCFSIQTKGQNDLSFGHYMFNPGLFNPSLLGFEQEAFLSFHHRTQWAGYDATLDPGGAPNSQMASLSAPVQGWVSGVGAFIINDRSGPLASFQMRLGVALKKNTNFGTFTLGIMPALNAASVNTDYYRFNDDNDPTIPTSSDTQYRPNLHAGILFTAKNNVFVSASVENTLAPSYSFGTEADYTLARSYYFFSGTSRRLSRNLEIKPYLLIRSNLTSYVVELSTLLEYREKMWGGLSYRSAESITMLLGYSFLEENKLKMGYAFDYIVSNREAKTSTSHEIYVRYNLPNLVFAGKKAIKTPRFSF